jgi:uncharacterized protein
VAARPDLACGHWQGDTLLLPVRVQPRARRLGIGPLREGRLKVALTAPPVDGKANAQARELLAERFGVSVSRVVLVQGEAARDKLFRIDGPQTLPPEILAS